MYLTFKKGKNIQDPSYICHVTHVCLKTDFAVFYYHINTALLTL
jgi:hypothetical protein